MITTSLIVDASVGIKWYIPEEHDAEARSIVESERKLHVPDLFFIEIGNIVWKRVSFGQATAKDATDIIHALLGLNLYVHSSQPLLARAVEIGISTGRTVYDSLYVALAEREGVPLVTADRKLHRALESGPFAARVRWIEAVLQE